MKSSCVTFRSATISLLRCSSRYHRLIRASTLKTRRCESCRREWMELKTAAPCSISACVVPTGALLVTSAIFSSLVVTTPLAASVNQPSSWNKMGLGGLNGTGMAILRMSSTPGAPSISATCVGSMTVLWPLILAPLILSIVGALFM